LQIIQAASDVLKDEDKMEWRRGPYTGAWYLLQAACLQRNKYKNVKEKLDVLALPLRTAILCQNMLMSCTYVADSGVPIHKRFGDVKSPGLGLYTHVDMKAGTEYYCILHEGYNMKVFRL